MRKCLSLLLFLGMCWKPLRSDENFILIDGFTSEAIQEFGPNIEERVTPASSFKIVLSLMGYDCEILENEQNPVWNFQKGYDDFLEPWRVSQTPQTWMRCSCVWFSKIITDRLGIETIKQYLSSFDYGNQDFSTGIISPGLTSPAWVSGSLKISPKEQVKFIQKMIQERLPVSKSALQMTKNLLFQEEMPQGQKLFGKTGLGNAVDENGETVKARWFTGWVESDQGFFPFAYLLQEREINPLQTIPRVKELLDQSELTGFKKGNRSLPPDVSSTHSYLGNSKITFFLKEDGALTVTIDTDRLHIRSIRDSEEDYERYASLFGNQDVMRTFGKGQTKTKEEIQAQIRDVWVKCWGQNDPYTGLAVFKNDTGEFLGHVMIKHGNAPGEAELAYLFMKNSWGKGFATEAVTALVKEYALATVMEGYTVKGKALEKITATVIPDNLFSLKILEKLGMHKVSEREKYGALRYDFLINLSELHSKISPVKAG